MKTFNTFAVLNEALGKVSPEAFTVLYFICNNLSMKNTNRTDIDRIDIAVRLGLWYDGCGKRLDNQLKKITKWTDELQEKNIISKDVIFDRNTNRRTVFYAISDTLIEQLLQKREQKLNSNCQKRYSTKKREIMKEQKEEKELKEIKEQNEEKLFDVECEASQEDVEEFCSVELPF